ncbi:hypothetical protein RhiirB3_457093 [Rhizophagus irregularis]|nr:hypothetical protein RhiirB3_457093 [Rhizophagus irregularis]
MLSASSGNNAELGVCQGKGLQSWEMLLSRPELEADRSLDLERDREQERALAVFELER